MLYIKKFNTDIDIERYIKNNFVSPHLFMNVQNRNINYFPKYKRLSYISSTPTGGQYINLGCQLMQTTDDIKIDIKFNIKGYGKDGNKNQPTLIAAQPEVSPYPGFTLRKQSTGADYMIELCTKWSFTNSSKQAAATRYDSMFLSYQQTDNSTTWVKRNWNNIYEFTEILDNIPSSQINDFSCHLFCALNSNNKPFRFVESDLYYLKFTKGNQIIRNLIPVQRISDNEVGLWDMEHQVFYTSQGDEPFVAGIE